MEKSKIIVNLSSLSEEQLWEEILEGNITLKELQETGEFGIHDPRYPVIKGRLEELEKREKQEDEDWTNLDHNNINSLLTHISKYPKSKHADEANQLIEHLREIRSLKREEILDNIPRNKYSTNEINIFLHEGTISEVDLMNCGIPRSIIDNLENIQRPSPNTGKTPESIPEGYTEVYFWGMQGSGKTTALAAILHQAEVKGYLNISVSPGYLYALTLKNIFSDDGVANDYLPIPTRVETTQYLPFTLKRPNEKHSRSISLIELSGEIFQCFLKNNANAPFPTQHHENTFNSLNKFLSSSNRKIHFFFIDYQRDNKPDNDGLLQSDYLDAASNYFNDHQIFRKTTDAIYIVVTKSDLMTDKDGNNILPEQRAKFAKEYFKERNYSSFVNTLKNHCKKYSINAGKLPMETFSLGKVYLQEICNFDGSAANNILDILIERIRPNKGRTILDIFNK